MNQSKIGYCAGGSIAPPDPDVILCDRECEACGMQMKLYQTSHEFSDSFFHYYTCQNIDCSEYDIRIEAETYIENDILIVE